MGLSKGVTEVLINDVTIENDRGTTWLVTYCVISKGEHIGQGLIVRQPISGVCGKVEFDPQ